MDNKAKTFIISGMDYNNKLVRRTVIAMTKKLAIKAALRTKIVKRYTHVKELKDDNQNVVC